MPEVGYGSKFWQQNEPTVRIRISPHQRFPPTVFNGINPQEIFNQEAVGHIDPDSDHVNVLEVGVGLEPSPVSASGTEAWTDWSSDSSPDAVADHGVPDVGHADHIVDFSAEYGVRRAPKKVRIRKKHDTTSSSSTSTQTPTESSSGSLEGIVYTTPTSDSDTTAESSALSTISVVPANPKYTVGVDHMVGSSVSCVIRSVNVTVYEAFTQVSEDLQTAGRGNFGMPNTSSKVLFF